MDERCDFTASELNPMRQSFQWRVTPSQIEVLTVSIERQHCFRKQLSNKRSPQHCCRWTRKTGHLSGPLKVDDEATGTDMLEQLYAEMKNKPVQDHLEIVKADLRFP